MNYCEACGKDEVDVLESFSCKYCQLSLCVNCLDVHEEECPYHHSREDTEADPKLLLRAEKKLKLLVRKWEGNCYSLACAFLKHKLVKGVARYGHWRGPVSPQCKMFFNSWQAMGWSNHGWVEMPDNKICDPTRWVFEAVEPYIFIGVDHDDYYDVNGNRWYATLERPVPVAKPGDRTIKSPKEKELKDFVHKRLLRSNTKVTLQQACWIGNRPPDEMFPYTKQIYLWLKVEGKLAYVPIENQLLVLNK